jgi:hypothetical protein
MPDVLSQRWIIGFSGRSDVGVGSTKWEDGRHAGCAKPELGFGFYREV